VAVAPVTSAHVPRVFSGSMAHELR